jgi:hypothetical protein
MARSQTSDMADTSRSTSSYRTAPEGRTSAQWHRDDQDLIAEILADLEYNCEEAFSRAPSNYRGSIDTTSTLRQGDTPVRRRGTSSASMGSQTTLEMEILEGEGRGRSRRTYAEGNDYVPDMMDSYRTSRRTSFSRTGTIHDGVADSAISLVKAKDKSNKTKSHLREAYATNEDATSPTSSNEQPEDLDQPPTYPSGAKAAVIMVSLYISIFLVALDRTIIGPAIPAITNQFNSIGDIGWYGSSYMLTSAGFILLYGRIYTFFPTKAVFLSGIVLFEIGSAICGAAQTSTMLIIGRAIAGLGSSGIFTGAILIMLNTVPLHRRPLLQGLFGACFGVASVAGPLLGGAFTGSKATWRYVVRR